MISVSKFDPPNPLATGVLFLVFNRLETTKQVFAAIRKARPPRLYIAADGPREKIEGENEKVQAVRDYIINNIDWECEVKTLFRDQNLGCKYAVSNAISWFFKNEKQGIILEDDCLPSQSFFWFCEELLEKYKNDLRIWHIGGASTLDKEIKMNVESYYLSKFNHIWGWATWADRWDKYDVNISLLDTFIKESYINNITENKLLQKFWLNNFKDVYNQTIDTWDYQWYFTSWINGGYSIIPTSNMISNIGFGLNATHTSDEDNKLSKMQSYEIDFPLNHPKILMRNVIYDSYNAKFLFELTYYKYVVQKLKIRIKKFITPNR